VRGANRWLRFRFDLESLAGGDAGVMPDAAKNVPAVSGSIVFSLVQQCIFLTICDISRSHQPVPRCVVFTRRA
jgi:hypothetical protein